MPNNIRNQAPPKNAECKVLSAEMIVSAPNMLSLPLPLNPTSCGWKLGSALRFLPSKSLIFFASVTKCLVMGGFWIINTLAFYSSLYSERLACLWPIKKHHCPKLLLNYFLKRHPDNKFLWLLCTIWNLLHSLHLHFAWKTTCCRSGLALLLATLKCDVSTCTESSASTILCLFRSPLTTSHSQRLCREKYSPTWSLFTAKIRYVWYDGMWPWCWIIHTSLFVRLMLRNGSILSPV